MEIVVINRALTSLEEDDILQKLNETAGEIHLFSNVTLTQKLEQYSKGSIELSPEEKKEINYTLFRKVLNFGEIKIDSTTITGLLMFENASIWHYHKFRTYFFIRNLSYDIRLIEKLTGSYQKITYYGDSDYLKSYPFSNPELTIHTNQTKSAKVNYPTLLKYSLFFIVRVLVNLPKYKKLAKTKHLVIDHAIKQTCLNIQSLKPEEANYYLAYLLDKLDEDFVILDDIDIPKFHKGFSFRFDKKRLKPKGKKIFGELILFKGLLSFNLRKQHKTISSDLYKKYGQIEASLMNPLDEITLQYLRALHPSSKLYLFKYLAYKKFFSQHRVKTISTIDENSPRIKTILDAAKSNGIKTIGIQHGAIHDLHPAYMFTLQDRKRKIVPDHTLVWGEHWKELLTIKGNYDPESLTITGQVRTDIIQALKNKKIAHSLNIPENHKVVLFASQLQQDPALREQSALDVFESIKDIPQVHLIVKLHPAEKNDSNYYKALAAKAGCKNYQIVLNTDLYLLISLSNIVVTCFSTVGAETVYFSKPLIILDHLKQDIQGYFKEGIAYQATNREELKNFLIKLISGDLIISEENYSNFIRKYAFMIDGKVSERILGFIRNL
jgi:hypothetical protein